jgi:hypothetical protein
MANPEAIALGPGWLYTAILGTPEPASLIAPWDPAWALMGYTHEGHSFTVTPEFEEVEVAEELYPVAYAPTKASGTVEFIAAEITAMNMQRANNGGVIFTGSGFVTFEPPELGQETRRMYGWQATDGTERFVWRRCLNQGDIEMARRKGAEKAGIPFSLNLEKPTGVQPWKWWGSSPLRVGV